MPALWSCTSRCRKALLAVPCSVFSLGEFPLSTTFHHRFRSCSTFDYVSMAILSLCAILAVLIGIGITLDDQGMLVPFLIVVSPAFLVTLGKGLHSWSQTGRPQPGKMLLTLLTAGVVTISVIALLIVAGIVMLFAICLSQIAPR